MVLHPERRPFYLITSPEEKIRHIASLGIDALILIPFSLDYARTTAEEFIHDVLWERLQIRKIIIGHDYTFGRGKEGNEAFLTASGNRLGFEVEVMSAFKVGDTTISSTRIRKALLAGEVGCAASLFGRPYNLGGRVIPGHHRGVSLGFPTANITARQGVDPPQRRLRRPSPPRRKPPPGSPQHRLQSDIHRSGSSPSRSISSILMRISMVRALDVLFVERLRDEIRFAGPGELIAQIGRDIARAREILRTEGSQGAR